MVPQGRRGHCWPPRVPEVGGRHFDAQEGPDGQKRLITSGLWGLNLAEARYAPVELECLRVVYAIQRYAFYIMGAPQPFTVVTNQKPLLGVFNNPLSETPNPRLQRLCL